MAESDSENCAEVQHLRADEQKKQHGLDGGWMLILSDGAVAEGAWFLVMRIGYQTLELDYHRSIWVLGTPSRSFQGLEGGLEILHCSSPDRCDWTSSWNPCRA